MDSREYKVAKAPFQMKDPEVGLQGQDQSSQNRAEAIKPQGGRQDAIEGFKVNFEDLKQACLVALEEKLKDMQKASGLHGGGGIPRFEGFEVSLSATWTTNVAAASESAKDVKFQLKLTCEDYPAKRPSVVCQDFLVEPKNLGSATNSGATNPHLPDSQNDRTKVVEKGQGSKQKARGKKHSRGPGN